jgi:hypothetical protein
MHTTISFELSEIVESVIIYIHLDSKHEYLEKWNQEQIFLKTILEKSEIYYDSNKQNGVNWALFW